MEGEPRSEPTTCVSVNFQLYLFQHDGAVVEDAHIWHAPYSADVEENVEGIMLSISLKIRTDRRSHLSPGLHRR